MRENKQEVASAVDEIYAILCALRGPRAAAMALAGAHVMLLETEGIRSPADARIRLQQSTQAVLDMWKERSGIASEQ